MELVEEPLREIGNLNLDQSDGIVAASESGEVPSTPSMLYTDVNVVPEHDDEVSVPAISSFQDSISLKAEISALRAKQRSLDVKRREALDKILDIKGSIRVFCRIRNCLLMDNKKIMSPISTGPEKITVRSVGTRKEFNVDKVFPQDSTQEDVFLEVEPILRSALDGHNVCILAYGQTGTGKTYTMEGTNDRQGVVPRAIEELFRQVSKDKSASFSLSMSMLEVYMGSLRDLLSQRHPSARAMNSIPKCSLGILTGSNGTVEVEGLADVMVPDLKQANRWYARGRRARATCWTNVNEASSRSHCLTRITICRSGDKVEGDKVVSKLWLVDLGGSERLLKTGATGQTLDEGKAINLSLSALGDVVAALKRKRSHIPYRNSKLTQILSDSLGDGSKVLMIVHVSPSEDDVAETMCSLSFAKRVRAIEANVSEDAKKQKEKSIAELEQQIHDTEEELHKVRSQMDGVENMVRENDKLFLTDDHKGSPRSPLIIDRIEIVGSPRTTKKAAGKACHTSVPHFMASTACSRRRQSAAGEANSKLRAMRFGNKSSANLLGSQFLSYSGPYLLANSRSSKSKQVTCEANISKCRHSLFSCNPDNASQNSTDLKPPNLARNKKASTSQPNLRVTSHQHRRRMCDLT
ncbi:kinesin-like protein KIN-14O [Cocos nucifera]|uniref:Kinesin-like protein KIN-14O n=1 Tax=Cocos nucifera TaxID=13894 RepID=A0A8K0MTV4_COCNU|nr:kinesin-like protein KIN-14O [Cocos nucifera]